MKAYAKTEVEIEELDLPLVEQLTDEPVANLAIEHNRPTDLLP